MLEGRWTGGGHAKRVWDTLLGMRRREVENGKWYRCEETDSWALRQCPICQKGGK